MEEPASFPPMDPPVLTVPFPGAQPPLAAFGASRKRARGPAPSHPPTPYFIRYYILADLSFREAKEPGKLHRRRQQSPLPPPRFTPARRFWTGPHGRIWRLPGLDSETSDPAHETALRPVPPETTTLAPNHIPRRPAFPTHDSRLTVPCARLRNPSDTIPGALRRLAESQARHGHFHLGRGRPRGPCRG